MRNRLYQESHTRTCQEIEELRRICCEEADRARQARNDELCLHQEGAPTTVSQLLNSKPGFTEQGEVLVRCKRISRSWHSEQLWSVPRSQSTLGYSESRTMPCRDSGLPHDTRNVMGTPGKVLKAYLLEKDHSQLSSSKLQGIWHHLLAD